jgi:Outer membrane protein beta-barrel domain
MKLILVLIIGSSAAFAQPISYGLKGGLPLTDFIDTVSGSRTTVSSVTNRYIVGPTFELRLPFGFGVEVDALYRHFSYNSTASLVDVLSTLRTTSNNWEFPLLLKKRFGGVGPVRPFVDAGVSFDKITGLSQTVSNLVFPNRLTTTSNSNPAELKNDFTAGFTMGGGVEIRLLILRITPEIRYTRWGTQQFNGIFPAGGASGVAGSLTSSQNQAEFLVGFTF